GAINSPDSVQRQPLHPTASSTSAILTRSCDHHSKTIPRRAQEIAALIPQTYNFCPDHIPNPDALQHFRLVHFSLPQILFPQHRSPALCAPAVGSLYENLTPSFESGYPDYPSVDGVPNRGEGWCRCRAPGRDNAEDWWGACAESWYS